MSKRNQGTVHKVVSRPVIDLTDMDVWVDDYDIEDESGGWEGSWLDPAEPPFREYKINTLILEGLDAWEPEDIKDILDIKTGDRIKVDFTLHDEDNEVEVRDDGAVVKNVRKVPEKNEIHLEVDDLYASWTGAVKQSQQGRSA